MISHLVLLLALNSTPAIPCEQLGTLSLPNTTITLAQAVPAGPFEFTTKAKQRIALPAYCKVAAVLKPSSDSHIEMELWLPAETWNGKFQAVGNGGGQGDQLPGHGFDSARRIRHRFN